MKDKSKVVHPVRKRKIVDSRSNKSPSCPIPVTNVNPWMETQVEKPDHDACVLHKLGGAANYLFLSLGTYFLVKLLFLVYNTGDTINVIIPP